MPKNNDLEIARNILHNAVQMNMSKDVILKISQKLDEYINAYYMNEENEQEHKGRIKEAEDRYYCFTPGTYFYYGASRFSGRQKGRSRSISSAEIHPHQKLRQHAKY